MSVMCRNRIIQDHKTPKQEAIKWDEKQLHRHFNEQTERIANDTWL